MAEASEHRDTFSRPILTWAIGILAVALASLATFMVSHADKVGHTGMIERVDAIKNDVAEIKVDVKTILRNGAHPAP
jgi:uncharacterized protein YoxC